MKKIIIFNPKDYRILFLLSAAIKAGYSPVHGNNIKYLWETSEEIILLNINPNEGLSKFGLHPDLDIFIRLKLANVKAWLYFPGKLDANNPVVQKIVKHFDAQMATESLDLNNPECSNAYLARYAKALRAAKVIASNKKDMTEYQALLVNTAYSLAEGKNNISIDSFRIRYERVLGITEDCLNRITKRQDLINLPGKEIAFGYLDTVSDFLDFSALREKCLNNYPFLTIIQYRQQGKEYNWLFSKKQLNIKIVFQLPSKETDYEILIEYPHEKMLRHLQKSIEGISKT